MAWTPLRWWESAGMTLADAVDENERQEWEQAPYIRIEDEDGDTVVACHDLSTITHEDARLMAAAPDMLDALRRAEKLVRQLTIRQIVADDEACAAAGLNPWCISEGLAAGHESISADFITRAIAKATEGE